MSGRRVSLVVADLAGAVAALAVIAGVVPITAYDLGGASVRITQWSIELTGGPADVRPPLVAMTGIPLVVAAAVLLVGALLAAVGRPRSGGAAVLLGAAGVAGTAATVFLRQLALAANGDHNRQLARGPGHLAAGTWLLVADGGLALLVVVLAARYLHRPGDPGQRATAARRPVAAAGLAGLAAVAAVVATFLPITVFTFGTQSQVMSAWASRSRGYPPADQKFAESLATPLVGIPVVVAAAALLVAAVLLVRGRRDAARVPVLAAAGLLACSVAAIWCDPLANRANAERDMQLPRPDWLPPTTYTLGAGPWLMAAAAALGLAAAWLAVRSARQHVDLSGARPPQPAPPTWS